MEIQGNRKIIPNAFDRTFRDFFLEIDGRNKAKST